MKGLSAAEHFGENGGEMIGSGSGGDGTGTASRKFPHSRRRLPTIWFWASTLRRRLTISNAAASRRSSSSSTRSRGMAHVRLVRTTHWPAGSASASWASGGVNTLRASLIASSITPAFPIFSPILSVFDVDLSIVESKCFSVELCSFVAQCGRGLYDDDMISRGRRRPHTRSSLRLGTGSARCSNAESRMESWRLRALIRFEPMSLRTPR